MFNILMPKKIKFKKHRKFKNKGLATSNNEISFGRFGLQALGRGIIESKHLEIIRRTLTNFHTRQVKYWLKLFPHLSKSKRPNEVRQGKGKGGVDCYFTHIKPGIILLEFDIVDPETIIELQRIFQSKLSFPIRILRNF